MNQKNWIIETLKQSHQFSEPFAQSLGAILSQQLKEQTGLDPGETRGMLLIWDESGETEDAVQYITADLFGPDYTGHRVSLGWKCAVHPGERLAPTDPLDPEAGHILLAGWGGLPVEYLRDLLANQPASPIISDLSIPVKWVPWWEVTLPDLIFHLETSQRLSDDKLEEVNAAFEAFLAEEAIPLINTLIPNYDPQAMRDLFDQINRDPSTQFPEAIDRFKEIFGKPPDQPPADEAIREAALQGYSKDWSGIKREDSDTLYYIHVDFLGQYFTYEVIICWLKTIERISQVASIVFVTVGD